MQPVKSAPDIVKIGSEFVIALIKKDEKKARDYLASNVVIPEIREDTPINRVSGLPSPKKNVSVSIAYFDDGELMKGRIALIWELSYREEQITDIRVVYDGANPFMNETSAVKKYEAETNNTVLVVSSFPFDITHVEGSIEQYSLILKYQNIDTQSTLRVKVEPINSTLETLKSEKDQFYSLKNNIKTLYQPYNHQLIFQYGDFRYFVTIQQMKQNTPLSDLIKVANSMLP